MTPPSFSINTYLDGRLPKTLVFQTKRVHPSFVLLAGHMSHVCETDGWFGPGVGSCRGGFDFTLMFQDGILGLLPHVALLLLALIRMATLRRRRSTVRRAYLGLLKTVMAKSNISPRWILMCQRRLGYAMLPRRLQYSRYGPSRQDSRQTCQSHRLL